ncbi:LysM peptidoglycan-binding domain-containing protein [Psychroserpens mesophilus]|uniref:LysM peptidoglycan-binding domain-containing protein n=1 Tax=Psychroserpens mesophilus TaxID=325473 RepID=UPI003D64DD8D
MLKSFRLIATVFVFATSGFGVFAQSNETANYKDVLLDGKPAKLNLVTGEITFTNGEIAKSRTAKKIQDSVLDNRTVIKTNLLKDMLVDSEDSKNAEITDSNNTSVNTLKGSALTSETEESDLTENPNKAIEDSVSDELLPNDSLIANQNSINTEDTTETNTSDFHLVKKGETLYALSKRYQTSLRQLMAVNDLETTLIKEGETLRVRNFDANETSSESVWIVSKGDTLYNIAKRNNTTVDDLKDLNELSSNLIKVGQKLQVNQNSTLSKK